MRDEWHGIGGRRWPARNIPATTARRSNGRSCSRARAASHPGRSGPGTTSRDRPRGAGSGASATAAPPGPRTTARPGGTSRSSRGGATGSWRWRWTFQNKRRRYSHEGRRDTGQRRPLPDIGAMRDTGRSPLHLLLDDRASRDGACGSDRRRRARGPARRPRTLRRQEDQGRPGKEGRHRVQETHRRHHARTGHDGRVRARTVRTAQDAGRRGRAREPAGPAGPTATPHARIWRAILPMSASAETGRTCVRWPAWRTGASSAIPPDGPGTQAWYWARSPPSTSRRRTSRKQGFAGRKGPQAPLPVF